MKIIQTDDIRRLSNALSNCFGALYWNVGIQEKFSTYTKYYFYAKTTRKFNEDFQKLFNSIGCLNYWSHKGRVDYMVVDIKNKDFDAVIGYLLLNKNKF